MRTSKRPWRLSAASLLSTLLALAVLPGLTRAWCYSFCFYGCCCSIDLKGSEAQFIVSMNNPEASTLSLRKSYSDNCSDNYYEWLDQAGLPLQLDDSTHTVTLDAFSSPVPQGLYRAVLRTRNRDSYYDYEDQNIYVDVRDCSGVTVEAAPLDPDPATVLYNYHLPVVSFSYPLVQVSSFYNDFDCPVVTTCTSIGPSPSNPGGGISYDGDWCGMIDNYVIPVAYFDPTYGTWSWTVYASNIGIMPLNSRFGVSLTFENPDSGVVAEQKIEISTVSTTPPCSETVFDQAMIGDFTFIDLSVGTSGQQFLYYKQDSLSKAGGDCPWTITPTIVQSDPSIHVSPDEATAVYAYFDEYGFDINLTVDPNPLLFNKYVYVELDWVMTDTVLSATALNFQTNFSTLVNGNCDYAAYEASPSISKTTVTYHVSPSSVDTVLLPWTPLDDMGTLVGASSCADYSTIAWQMSKDNGVTYTILDPDLFVAVTNYLLTTLVGLTMGTNDLDKAGVYQIQYRINLGSGQSTWTDIFEVTVVDLCTPEGGLELTSPTIAGPFQYYYTGLTLTVDLSSFSSTHSLSDCPITTVGCSSAPTLTDNALCQFGDFVVDSNNAAVVHFNQRIGAYTASYALALHDYNLHTYGDYIVEIEARAGTNSDVVAVASFTVTLECVILLSEVTFNAFQVPDLIVYPYRGYDQQWQPGMLPYDTLVPINPWSTYTGESTPVISYTGSKCAGGIVGPIELDSRFVCRGWTAPSKSNEDDGSFHQYEYPDTALVCDYTTFASSYEYQFEMISFTNLWQADLTSPATLQKTFTVQQIDQSQTVRFDQYVDYNAFMQKDKLIDLNAGEDVLLLTPKFSDDYATQPFYITHERYPFIEYEVFFKIKDQLDVDPERLLGMTLAASGPNFALFTPSKVVTCQYDTFELIECYKYGDLAGLQELCDLKNPWLVTSALGHCFIDFKMTNVEQVLTEIYALAPYTFVIGETGPTEVADLGALVELDQYLIEIGCGELGYLLEPDHALTEYVTVDVTTGLVTVDAMEIDQAFEGFHDLVFFVYLREEDPERFNIFPISDLRLTLDIQIPPPPIDTAILASDLLRAKPVAREPLKSVYEGYLGTLATYDLLFADPLALPEEESLLEVQVKNVTFDGLQVSVTSNDLFDFIKVETRYPEVGFATVKLQIDGVGIQQALASPESVIELSEEAEGVEATIVLEIQDLSTNGQSTTFTLKVQVVASPYEDTSEESQEKAEAEDPAQLEAQRLQTEQFVTMMFSLAEALQPKQPVVGVEPVVIEASLKDIDEVGRVYVDFSPRVVAVPTDWHKLWSIEEREKMRPDDREAFEAELTKIMSIQFRKNSEEPDQKFFTTNMTTFTESGIELRLNFSDPLLISAGAEADSIEISLLKSYFMEPDPVLAYKQATPARQQRRNLARLVESEEYLTIIEEMPRQVKSAEEQAVIQAAVDTTVGALQSQFAVNFALSLVLNGVMNQLWNIFNTLQIILALPLLSVIMPGNVQMVQEGLESIVNFKLVDDETIDKKVIEPIFGSQKEEGEASDSETSAEIEAHEGANSQSILTQVALLVIFLIVALLLIGVLLVCKYSVLPRCCPCFKKLVRFIMGKLMFNSILRACLQTFLTTTLGAWLTLATRINMGTPLTSDSSVPFVEQPVANKVTTLLIVAYGIGLPVFAFYFLRQNADRLPDPDFKIKYDSFYVNLDYYKKGALSNTCWFLLRRLLFGAVIAFCSSSIVLQVMAIDVLSTLLLAYFINVRPMADGLNNLVQIVNELVVLLCVQLMFLFTEYVGDPQQRYTFAEPFMYFIGVDIGVNVLFLVFTIGKKIYTACRVSYARRKAKKQAKARAQAKSQATVAPAVQEDQSQVDEIEADSDQERVKTRKAISQLLARPEDLSMVNIPINILNMKVKLGALDSSSSNSESLSLSLNDVPKADDQAGSTMAIEMQLKDTMVGQSVAKTHIMPSFEIAGASKTQKKGGLLLGKDFSIVGSSFIDSSQRQDSNGEDDDTPMTFDQKAPLHRQQNMIEGSRSVGDSIELALQELEISALESSVQPSSQQSPKHSLGAASKRSTPLATDKSQSERDAAKSATDSSPSQSSGDGSSSDDLPSSYSSPEPSSFASQSLSSSNRSSHLHSSSFVSSSLSSVQTPLVKEALPHSSAARQSPLKAGKPKTAGNLTKVNSINFYQPSNRERDALGLPKQPPSQSQQDSSSSDFTSSSGYSQSQSQSQSQVSSVSLSSQTESSQQSSSQSSVSDSSRLESGSSLQSDSIESSQKSSSLSSIQGSLSSSQRSALASPSAQKSNF